MPQHELLACAQCGCFAFSCFEDFAIRVNSTFGSDAWSSGPTPSALPSPISSEPTPVPADDRLRFHDDEDALPVSPDSAQQHPKPAVDLREPRPFHGTAEDGELLPKSDILSRASSRRAFKAEMRAGTNDEIMPAWCWQTGD